MKRTISGMMGAGSLAHNRRAFIAENVDADRTHLNVKYYDENLRKVYPELFNEAIERYNAYKNEMTVRLLITMRKSVRGNRRNYFMR